MSGSQGQSIGDLAGQVVQADVSSQQAIEEHEKGTWTPITTGAPFVPDWSQKGPVTKTGWTMWQKAAAVIAGIAVLIGGIFGGYTLLGGQPAGSPSPTQVAAVPTAGQSAAATPGQSAAATPVTATPVVSTQQPVSTPTATATPVVSTLPPTPVVTAPPIRLPPGVDTVLTGPPVSYGDGTADQAVERPDDPDVPAAPQLELVGGYVAPGEVTGNQGLAMAGSWVAGTVRAAQVDELWPCTNAAVICGPGTLEPGDYFVIGFNTAAPPPTESPDGIYQVFYLMTDLDGDWTNNAYVTPPNTNYIYLSSQYVIEGGFFGPTKGLGETDYRGPVGPDGETPRYNTPPASRLVLSQDPPGGFFIVPEDHIGSWFRVATMWRDFNTEERHILVDSLGAQGGLEMMPVPGRAELPSTLECVRVNVLAEELDDQPAQLEVAFRVPDDLTLAGNLVANLTILTTTQDGSSTIDHRDLTLAGGDTLVFHVGVASQAQHGFVSLTIGPAGGPQQDITEEFIVLGGAGVNVPDGFSGFALGNPDCGT